MIAAKQARERTIENISKCLTNELDSIMKEIEKAIKDGKFYINLPGCLRDDTKNRLEELGYEVKSGSQYNEYYYIISWR